LGCRYDGSDAVGCWILAKLSQSIAAAISSGFEVFISGGAVGVDQWAAAAVLDAKKGHPEVRLVIARPFPSQSAAWPLNGQRDYETLLRNADKVLDISPDPYTGVKMLLRDEWMVDHAEAVIAVWNGYPGGTGHTVGYAQKQGKPVLRLDPISKECNWLGSGAPFLFSV
jgi:uncharacterized phage-like protein YoqJ